MELCLQCQFHDKSWIKPRLKNHGVMIFRNALETNPCIQGDCYFSVISVLRKFTVYCTVILIEKNRNEDKKEHCYFFFLFSSATHLCACTHKGKKDWTLSYSSVQSTGKAGWMIYEDLWVVSSQNSHSE